MLKITKNTGSIAKFKETKNKFDGDNMVSSNEVTNQKSSIKKLSKTAKSKNLVQPENQDLSLNSKKRTGLEFFIPRARLTFIKLRQVFIKALIVYYFNLECHRRIKINASRYAIARILS